MGLGSEVLWFWVLAEMAPPFFYKANLKSLFILAPHVKVK